MLGNSQGTPAPPRLSVPWFNQYATMSTDNENRLLLFSFILKRFLGHNQSHDPERGWLASVTGSLWSFRLIVGQDCGSD